MTEPGLRRVVTSRSSHRRCPKRRYLGTVLAFLFLMMTILQFVTLVHFLRDSLPAHRDSPIECSYKETLTVVILTYRKHEALANLLPSVLYQQQSNFEIIIVDNGCIDETKAIIGDTLGKDSSIQHKYLPLCNNPGYAAGNNAGVKLASCASKYILFFNDDIVLSGPHFIQNMVQLAQSKNAAAVGCKLLNADGSKLVEAGSIVWEDGHALGYGRGRKDVNAPEFSYPKPVDYISGACLLVEKKVFEDYGGFKQKEFPNYYEDTDLQMHIQHNLGKEVWFQPKSVATHDEHGSFGTEKSQDMMKRASKVFLSKWRHALSGNHIKSPWQMPGEEKEMQIFRGADLRARNSKKANVLYIDQLAPNKSKGSGFGRSFDNLSMIADLGHRVTLVTATIDDDGSWCDDDCADEITGLGVEYVTSKWDELVQSRIGYYDVVLISRPSTMQATYKKLGEFYKQHPFSLVYDSEALWFRRDEMLMNLVEKQKIPFPGSLKLLSKLKVSEIGKKFEIDMEVFKDFDKKSELALFPMADAVITVSDSETKLVSQLSPDVKNVHTIGHVMTLDHITQNSFGNRTGILFLASFNHEMYYNGDAIWYFLTEVYPLVIKESSSDMPIQLTIAGRGIPTQLRTLVLEDEDISQHVTFVESPPTIVDLFEQHRIFIAPHLYGAGIQYKVSEALSMGLPVVMSVFTQESFGSVPGCIGSDSLSFKKCIIDVHRNKEQWATLRQDGTDYIRRTHSRKEAMEQWSIVIDRSLKKISERRVGKGIEHGLLTAKIPKEPHFPYPKKACADGEKMYLSQYMDVAEAIQKGTWKKSGFQHWKAHGKSEGRTYYCLSDITKSKTLTVSYE